MPELPDIAIYLEALRRRFAGQRLESIALRSAFLVRTVEPDLFQAEGRVVLGFERLGKRIAWRLEGDLFLVFHLMIAGRFHLRAAGARPRTKADLAAFRFADATVMLTEASPKQRASLHVVAGEAGLAAHRPGGLEVLAASLDQFRDRLVCENHTLKRALTDPWLFSGIGNAYSDEILHAARLSPVKLTRRLSDEEIARLFTAARDTLSRWVERLRAETGEAFPEKVTAFRPGMAAHGRYGKPCPVCETPIQRIRYAEHETNYCPRCQTGGKLLADRSLSRLLKDDWPRTIAAWEAERPPDNAD